MHKLKSKKQAQELVPPDLDRCQARVPGNGPFTVGGKIGDPRDGYRVRCDNVPTVIAVEKQAGPDGLIGSMSLCDECKKEFLKMFGKDFATIRKIKKQQEK